MFDMGFTELMIIAVVALIVIGPERLPRVARTAGHMLGRMQRYVNDVKADITREMQFEELRKLQSEMEQTARSIETTVTREARDAEEELNRVAREASVDAAPTPLTAEAAPSGAGHLPQPGEAAPRPAQQDRGQA